MSDIPRPFPPSRSAPYFVAALLLYQVAAVCAYQYFDSTSYPTPVLGPDPDRGWMAAAALAALAGLATLGVAVWRFANNVDYLAWRRHVESPPPPRNREPQEWGPGGE